MVERSRSISKGSRKHESREDPSSRFSRALAFEKQGLLDQAVKAYDDIVCSFGNDEQPELLHQVALALVKKGITLGRLNRSEEEIAVYDDVVRRFGSSENADLLAQVAMALVNKGITLGQLNRSKEAMAVYDEVVRSFSADAMLAVPVARALAAKASLELEAGNFSESVVLSERALSFVVGYPSAVQMRLRATFRAGKLLEGFQILRDFLSEINRTDPLRSSLVTLVLEENHGKDVALRELVDLYHETPDSLSMGFIGWVQKLLPMGEAKAKALESTERVLKDLFGQVPTWSLALDLFTAVRHHAMGDRKALLDLPLEIRRLLPQEPE